MSKKYTEDVCIERIEELYRKEDLNKLYSKLFINWVGKTIDTKKDYQEIFSKYICDRLIDKRIPNITVSKIDNYCEKDRKDNAQNDDEEKIQREYYFKRRKISQYDLGEPIWFELQTGEVGQGKGIDLVYFNSDNHCLSIIELKYKSKETLLRAILEIQTYYQRVNWYKAVNALRKRKLLPENTDIKIEKYIMFDEGSKNIFEKYNVILNNDEHYLNKLLNEFQIKAILY